MLSLQEIGLIGLSLKVSFWSTLVCLPIAVGLAWILSRYQFIGKSWFDGFIHAPLVMPPVVIGYILLLVFGRSGPVGKILDQIGFPLAFNWKGAVLAAMIMTLPLMVRALRLSFDAIDAQLERAAAGLGAKPYQVMRYITLPLALPGLLAALVLGFARALGEFGATITFVASIPGETRTLPLSIYALSQIPGAELRAGRLVVISFLIALFALFATNLLEQRVVKNRDN